MERAQILQELARLAPAKMLTHDGDVKIDGILSSGKVVSRVVGNTNPHHAFISKPKNTSMADVDEVTDVSAHEELEQWRRHIRLLLPPCYSRAVVAAIK